MTSVRGATPGPTIEGDQEVEKERWLGRQPIGLLFILPYVIFLVGIFVYPLVVQFVISFNDFFFAAPGATVDRPWVGLQNYVDVLQDPTFQRSLFNVFVFMIINVPATVVPLARAGLRIEYEDPRAVVLPRRLLRALRHGQRGDRDGLAVHVRRDRPRQHRPRAAGPRPVLADQQVTGPCP